MLKILFILSALAAVACTMFRADEDQDDASIFVFIEIGSADVKSADPSSEEVVSDVNLFVFSNGGILESHLYADSRSYKGTPIPVKLLRGARYDIAACLNFGYNIPGITCKEDLLAMKYYMVYPDEYRPGIPMAALVEDYSAPRLGQANLTLWARRLMSRITLTFDRSHLDKDVTMNVYRAELKSCPRNVTPFSPNTGLGSEDIFKESFFKDGLAVDNLNKDAGNGISREVYLYMLESLGASSFKPYVELKLSYKSPKAYSYAGEYLIYRFYIGEDGQNIVRNSNYSYTITPHGDGLSDSDSWRVDKTGLNYP